MKDLFSVPIWQAEFPDFEKYKDIFLSSTRKYKEKNISVEKSNINGYQTPDTLQKVKELAPLFQHACAMGLKASHDVGLEECDIALTGAWANFNDNPNSCNITHIHSDSWSGVFYLKVPEGSGRLRFNNPLMTSMWNANYLLDDNPSQYVSQGTSIVPKEGMMVLFPSYLPHSVDPNMHDGERISISYNLLCMKK